MDDREESESLSDYSFFRYYGHDFPECVADLNWDRTVGSFDEREILDYWAPFWYACPSSDVVCPEKIDELTQELIPETCIADLDDNGKVAINDMLILLARFSGEDSCEVKYEGDQDKIEMCLDADLDFDGFVDTVDLLLVTDVYWLWQPGCESVPKPLSECNAKRDLFGNVMEGICEGDLNEDELIDESDHLIFTDALDIMGGFGACPV